MHRPAAIAALLSGVFQGEPLQERLKEGKIWLIWDAAVGEQIANRAQPASIRNGVLTVVVASSAWMQQLNFLKAGIREKLNRTIGEELVKEIFLKAGRPERQPPQQQRPTTTTRPLTPAELARIAAQTAVIENPELREELAGLMARHLAKVEPTD
jgi:predicted nucleic acid-binding Zn ribbon protein